MCISGKQFTTKDMYVAVDTETDEILIGGGNDKMLPFVNFNPKIAPTRIKSPITDKMHSVKWQRAYIYVEILND